MGSWEMQRVTPNDDRHIKFKLDQVGLPKDLKLFHGQSLEVIEDILKSYCDKLEGRKNGQCDEKKASEVRISEISRIGSNPKATMLADESLLQLMVVFKMRPLISDMVAIFNIL